MHLSFYPLAVVTAGLFSLLAILWMFAPAAFLTAWGVKDSAEARLIGRRVAALYVGVAAMFFIARNAAPSMPRTALVYGLISICLILATLGCYELLAGSARKGILAAVLIELALSLLFMQMT